MDPPSDPAPPDCPPLGTGNGEPDPPLGEVGPLPPLGEPGLLIPPDELQAASNSAKVASTAVRIMVVIALYYIPACHGSARRGNLLLKMPDGAGGSGRRPHWSVPGRPGDAGPAGATIM